MSAFYRRLVPMLTGVLFIFVGSLSASAAAFQVGARIPLTATGFALPIEIVDGDGVAAWTFDLAYDPSDVQVYTACDPFTDSYCSLLTGPVTEGDFFAAGAPFNLLVPGFVDLDPGSLAQTGLLFGVNGAYGGPPPLPSGSGVIAYVLFTTIGTGDSPITIETGTVTEVPEPASAALMALGVLALARRRFRDARALAVLVFLCGVAGAHAQTVAVGPYYATPSWDQKIACESLANCPRFVVLSNWDKQAVLDRETGLVWQQAPFPFTSDFAAADAVCRDNAVAGGRYGWRLASPEELASLADPTNVGGVVQLPRGHPFDVDATAGTTFWTSLSYPGREFALAYNIGAFDPATGIRPGILPFAARASDRHRGWCVRGPR